MNAQEEVKARLEVAQLYEEMGQNPKAARYYLAAAEICLKSKLYSQGQEFLQKVLQLDPDNAQAKSYLEKLEKHLAAHGMGTKSSSSGGGPAGAAPAPAAGGELTVPTPALYLTQDQISAILSQVTSAPNAKFFPFDPLPRVDKEAIARKAAQAEAKRAAERDKERTSVESAFNSGESSFNSTTGFLNQAQRGGPRRSRKDKDKAKSKDKGDKSKRRRRSAGGNQSLAESIARRVREG